MPPASKQKSPVTENGECRRCSDIRRFTKPKTKCEQDFDALMYRNCLPKGTEYVAYKRSHQAAELTAAQPAAAQPAVAQPAAAEHATGEQAAVDESDAESREVVAASASRAATGAVPPAATAAAAASTTAAPANGAIIDDDDEFESLFNDGQAPRRRNSTNGDITK